MGCAVIQREDRPVGDKVTPAEDASHAREQQSAEQQLLAEHGAED
jgi:hypothetical protein